MRRRVFLRSYVLTPPVQEVVIDRCCELDTVLLGAEFSPFFSDGGGRGTRRLVVAEEVFSPTRGGIFPFGVFARVVGTPSHGSWYILMATCTFPPLQFFRRRALPILWPDPPLPPPCGRFRPPQWNINPWFVYRTTLGVAPTPNFHIMVFFPPNGLSECPNPDAPPWWSQLRFPLGHRPVFFFTPFYRSTWAMYEGPPNRCFFAPMSPNAISPLRMSPRRLLCCFLPSFPPALVAPTNWASFL